MNDKNISNKIEFGWHWIVKVVVLIVAAGLVLFGMTAEGEVTFQALIAAGLLTVFFSLAAARFFLHRIVLMKEEIRNRDLFWTSTIRYEEINTLDLSDPLCLMKVIGNSDRLRTDLKVYPGISGWRRLVSELIERSPDKVEIFDPYDRLKTISGKEGEGAKDTDI